MQQLDSGQQPRSYVCTSAPCNCAVLAGRVSPPGRVERKGRDPRHPIQAMFHVIERVSLSHAAFFAIVTAIACAQRMIPLTSWR